MAKVLRQQQEADCPCQVTGLWIRGRVADVLDELRQAVLTVRCLSCGQYFRYELADCNTLGTRTKIYPS